MSVEWIQTSPVILTDDLFFSYVPTPLYTGTSVIRQAAYVAAEQAIAREVKSPLIPTTLTGTWMWPQLHGIGERTIVMPHRRIQSVGSVVVLYGGGTGSCGLQEEAGCFRIRDDGYGFLDIYCVGNLARAACRCGLSDIYQVRVSYTAGIPTGISSQDPSLHRALAMIAEEEINEMVDPGANPGGPGAPGIESYSSLGHSEKLNPKSLKMTSMGASARMNKARRLIRHYIRKRVLRM